MTGLLKNAGLFVQKSVRAELGLGSFITKRWCTAEHTLAVRKKIDEIRDKALVGGGQKRIDAQHKKVDIRMSLSQPTVRRNLCKVLGLPECILKY